MATRKANLSSREKATLEIVRNNQNENVIKAVHDLHELMNDTSQLLDQLYFMSIRKGSVDNTELTSKLKAYAEAVNTANKSVSNATKKTVRVLEVNVSEEVKV